MITIHDIYRTLYPVAQQIGEATAAGTAVTVSIAGIRSLFPGTNFREQFTNWENYSLGAFITAFTLIPGVDFSETFPRAMEYAGAAGTGAIFGGILGTVWTAARQREVGLLENQPQRFLRGAAYGTTGFTALYGLIEYFATK